MTTTTITTAATETAGAREMARQEFVRRYSRKFQYRFGPVQGLDTAVRHSLMLVNLAADYLLFKEFYPDSETAQSILLYATAGTLSVLAILLLFWRQMIHAWKRHLLDDDEEDVLAGAAGVKPHSANGGPERRKLLVRNRRGSAGGSTGSATSVDGLRHLRRGSAPPGLNTFNSHVIEMGNSNRMATEGGETVCTDKNCTESAGSATRPEEAVINVFSKMKKEEDLFRMKQVTKMSSVAAAKTASIGSSIGHGTSSLASSSARNIGSRLVRIKSSKASVFGNGKSGGGNDNGDDAEFLDLSAMEQGEARKSKNTQHDVDDGASESSRQSNQEKRPYSGSNNSHPSGLAPITLVVMVAVGDGVFKAGLLQRDFDDTVMIAAFAVFLIATLLSMYTALVEAYYGMLIFANLEWIVGDNIEKESDGNDDDRGGKKNSRRHHSKGGRSRSHRRNRRSTNSVRSRTHDVVMWVKSPRRKRHAGFAENEENGGSNRPSNKSKVVDSSSGHKKHKDTYRSSSKKKLGAFGKRLSRSRPTSSSYSKDDKDKKKKKETEMTYSSASKRSKRSDKSPAKVSERALRKLSELGQRQEDDADEDGSDGIINAEEHEEFKRKHGRSHSSSGRKKRASA